MTTADPFDPDRWQTNVDPVEPSTPAPRKLRTRSRRPGRFVKGPVPWLWLRRAMALPGKALAVGLMLWLLRGMTGCRTVRFCLNRAAEDGIPTTTARRALRSLETAGLVAVVRLPGRGAEVTILDESAETPACPSEES